MERIGLATGMRASTAAGGGFGRESLRGPQWIAARLVTGGAGPWSLDAMRSRPA